MFYRKMYTLLYASLPLGYKEQKITAAILLTVLSFFAHNISMLCTGILYIIVSVFVKKNFIVLNEPNKTSFFTKLFSIILLLAILNLIVGASTITLLITFLISFWAFLDSEQHLF
jgi:hypothetical protein